MRCARARTRFAARQLYAGRGFSLASDAARAAGAQFRIVSAGMGLLQPNTAVPPYSLTLSPSAEDCIFSRARPELSFSAREWWRAITAGSRSLEQLLSPFSRHILLIAMTRPYLAMIAQELSTLDEGIRDRLRILGLTQPDVMPDELRRCVMPYDARLNHEEAALRGTAFDFPARALVHFLGMITADHRIDTPERHSQRVQRSLARWVAPDLAHRNLIDDGTLARQIELFKRQELSRTAALRRLRSEMRCACSQERFAMAWGRL